MTAFTPKLFRNYFKFDRRLREKPKVYAVFAILALDDKKLKNITARGLVS